MLSRAITRIAASRAALLMLAGLAIFAAAPAYAVQPDEILKDPALEQRARGISAELRCLVCQNQSIDDSDAPLARDLRLLVREELLKGKSDQQVIDYIVDRYGEFVLLRPRLAPHTLLLWLATPLILILGAVVVFLSYRRRRAQEDGEPDKEAPLDAAEERRVRRLLDQT